VAWLALVGSLALSGDQSPLVFPATTELVKVVVSVTDASGQPIRGLSAKDFTVRADGKARPIATLTHCADSGGEPLPDCPVDLVLLLDTSASMLWNLRRARDAAAQFVESVPAARGRNIVSFDSEIRVWDYGEEGPAKVLDEILDRGEGRGTRLFTAVLRAIPLAFLDPTRRAIMVALTDGEDTGGALARGNRGGRGGAAFDGDLEKVHKQRLLNVAEGLQKRSIGFYAISFAHHLGSGKRRDYGASTLKTLTEATGGLVVDGQAADLKAQFARIRNDIAAQYVLGFVPASSPPGRIHKLQVKVTPKDASVRHRLAYQTKSPAP
jgi:VWFA-related protein